MEYQTAYGYGKSAWGVGSDVYGAWQTGQNYEAQTAAYGENARNETINNRLSWDIQEGAKDQAMFGGMRAADEYLAAGNRKLGALGKQMDANNAQVLMQHNLAYEQSAAVDETVGNMMSRNAITNMKAEARLRASAAGTGTSGGTTAIAVQEADSIQMFDNAVLIGRAEGQKLNIFRRLSMERVSAKNKQLYVASQLGSVFSSQGASAAYEKGKAGTYAGISASRKSGYISEDKIKTRDTKTWADDLFNITDIIEDSDLDDLIMKGLTSRDKTESDRIKELKEKYKTEAGTQT